MLRLGLSLNRPSLSGVLGTMQGRGASGEPDAIPPRHPSHSKRPARGRPGHHWTPSERGAQMTIAVDGHKKVL